MQSFTALLLTQRFLKISARTPVGKDCLMVLALRVCQGRLLLEQVAEQERLLRISYLLVAHLLCLGITDCLCDCKVRTRFSEAPKIRIHAKKNLFPCVFDGESRLFLRKGSLPNLMAFLTPIPRLPGEQCANGTYVLRQKIDICRTEVACLDGDIRNVMRLLAFGRQISLAHTICREFYFGTMFDRSGPGSRKVLLFRECRGNGLHRKLRLHAAP